MKKKIEIVQQLESSIKLLFDEQINKSSKQMKKKLQMEQQFQFSYQLLSNEQMKLLSNSVINYCPMKTKIEIQFSKGEFSITFVARTIVPFQPVSSIKMLRSLIWSSLSPFTGITKFSTDSIE